MSRALVVKHISKLNRLLDDEEGKSDLLGGGKKKGGCATCGGCGPWGYPNCGQSHPGPLQVGGDTNIPYGLWGSGLYGNGSAVTTNIYKRGYPFPSRRPSLTVAGRRKSKRGGSSAAANNPWVQFLKNMERETGRSYSDLLSDPNSSVAYHNMLRLQAR